MSRHCPSELPPLDDHANTHFGRCHICGGKELIACCEMCKHWFCYECRKAWWNRPWEAIKQVIKDTTSIGKKGEEGECCGPTADADTGD
jgi:hypothetical protein